MQSGSDDKLRTIILSVITQNWQKTAMVIMKAFQVCKAQQVPADEDRIAGHLEELIESGQVEAQGQLSNWRYSELRLRE